MLSFTDTLYRLFFFFNVQNFRVWLHNLVGRSCICGKVERAHVWCVLHQIFYIHAKEYLMIVVSVTVSMYESEGIVWCHEACIKVCCGKESSLTISFSCIIFIHKSWSSFPSFLCCIKCLFYTQHVYVCACFIWSGYVKKHVYQYLCLIVFKWYM